MTSSNPYDPPAAHGGATAATHAPASTWLRNLKSVAAVTVAYSLASVLFAVVRAPMPEPLSFLALFTVSASASAWANIPLGAQVGWARGGLPVVMIVCFGALVAHCLVALAVGEMLYAWVNPITIYSPYPPPFPF